ncbi:MAG: hypothetical protein ACPGWM_01050 [Flavobacteriales bacterium]
MIIIYRFQIFSGEKVELSKTQNQEKLIKGEKRQFCKTRPTKRAGNSPYFGKFFPFWDENEWFGFEQGEYNLSMRKTKRAKIQLSRKERRRLIS